jgi:hypothetical protein
LEFGATGPIAAGPVHRVGLPGDVLDAGKFNGRPVGKMHRAGGVVRQGHAAVTLADDVPGRQCRCPVRARGQRRRSAGELDRVDPVAAPSVDRIGAVTELINKQIIAATAVRNVVAGAAENEGVVTATAIERVVAAAGCNQGIVAGATIENIVAAAASDQSVVASSAVEDVVSRSLADQAIVAGAAV